MAQKIQFGIVTWMWTVELLVIVTNTSGTDLSQCIAVVSVKFEKVQHTENSKSSYCLTWMKSFFHSEHVSLFT